MNSMYPFNPLQNGGFQFNPYLQQNPMYQAPQMQAQAPRMEIPKVNGEESARAFAIGPDSSVILMDTNQPLIWVVVTDASGYKTVTPFAIAHYKPEQPVTADDLKTQLSGMEERLRKLEERMSGYGQSNIKPAWKGKPGNGNAQPDDRNGAGVKGPDGNT